jgi:hypothetical protein
MKGVHFVFENLLFFKRIRRGPARFGIFLTILTAGCGLPGGLAVTDETVPSSAIYLTSGALTGSGEISGTAQVYLSGSTILLHLEGLVSPAGSVYSIFLEDGSPSFPFYSSPLKATFGNQNYATGRTSPPSHFSRVAIRAGSSTTATEMASAVLAPY